MAIDRQALDKLQNMVGGDEADLIEIIASFLDEAPALMDALQKSARKGDLDLMRRSAHSLKSNARDMGAFDLAETCSRIEKIAGGGAAVADEDVARAAQEMTDAIFELRRMYDFGGSA